MNLTTQFKLKQVDGGDIVLSIVGMIESENWMWATTDSDQYVAYRASSNHTLKTIKLEYKPTNNASGESFTKDMSDLSWMNPSSEGNRR